MKRKFLAALLALVMVFSMIPVSASAAGDGEYDIVRLIERSEWQTAAFSRAGVEKDGVISLQRFFIYNENGELLNSGAAADGGSDLLDYYYADTEDIRPDEISRIVVTFTNTVGLSTTTVSASFSKEDFTVSETGGVVATKFIELSLTDRGKSVPSGHAVRFYAELNDETTYTLYDTVYIQDGQQIGNQMPNDPPVGSYMFLGWQTKKDGGTAVGSETYVYGDMDVYAAKGTAGEGHAQEYHVMSATEKRSNALAIEVADHYNAENHTSFGVESFTIDDIAVNGTNTTTNYQYHTDEWKNEKEYYYIYNVTAWAANVTPEYKNERVPVNDVTGITVYGKLNGNDYSAFIPRSELELVETQNNVVVEIRVREKLDGISKELVTTETVDVPTGAGITIPAPGEIVSVPADGTVTLMYKITVTGDSGSAYKITDEGAAVVDGYSLTGTIDHTGTATIYVTKTFTSSDVKNGSLINTASVVPGDDTTLGTDENQGSASDDVGAEVDDGEEDPDQPGGGDEPKEPDLSGVKIQVACTNVEHPASSSYRLFDDSYSGTMSENGDVYTVTVSAEEYVSQFSEDTGKTHRIDEVDEELPSDTLTIVYTYDGESWQTSGKGNTFFVTCAESGEEQPTPPSITPEDVITLMGDNAIKVVCETEGSEHNPSSYRLILGSFTVGTVTEGEDGKYSCVITIDEDGILQYVDAYDEVVGSEHTAISFGPITFTITHDGTKWLQPEVPVETITVVCEADQEDELDEGDLNEILGGAITVQCVSEEDHGYKTLTLYELLENASLGDASLENIYSFIKNADGTYTVTLDGEKFASAYGTYVSDKIGKGENIPHQLVNEENADFEIRLTYDGIKWTFDPDPIVIEVTCEDDSGDEPTPTPTPNPGPDPDPDPDPDPIPTPTPDPGDDDNPPYIPPVDPDDSGVSDLLNTDDHIQYLFGYPEGTFGPENNMTRAEVAQMFYNLLLDQDVTITKTFDDVPANAWYAKAVNTLASLGVVSGVGNGDFEPERSITRAEFTSIAMKFAEGKTGGTNIFSDVKSTDWFYRAVVNSTQYGWIHGYGDGTFRPNNPITRVEVTAIVNNMLGREADVDFVTEHYDELNHFSDLAVSHWGYYHIVEATNDHDYTKPSSGENWTELN